MTRSKVDRYLHSLELAIGSLSAVAARRETRSQAGPESDDELADRIAFQDAWWDQIDRLDTLSNAYARGELIEDQAARLVGLLASMLDALPVVRRLGLRSPSTEHIETARHLAQRGTVAKGA